MLAKVATLQEIETHYSILDVMTANEVLDIQEEADAQAVDDAKRASTKSHRG